MWHSEGGGAVTFEEIFIIKNLSLKVWLWKTKKTNVLFFFKKNKHFFLKRKKKLLFLIILNLNSEKKNKVKLVTHSCCELWGLTFEITLSQNCFSCVSNPFLLSSITTQVDTSVCWVKGCQCSSPHSDVSKNVEHLWFVLISFCWFLFWFFSFLV